MRFSRSSHWTIVVLAAIVLAGALKVRADVKKGWVALHELRIDDARKEFASPSKKAAEENLRLRGLLLCDYCDLRLDRQIQDIEDLVAADPANPYLLAIFEMAAGDLDGMNKQRATEILVTDALDQNGIGRLSFLGRVAKLGQYSDVLASPPDSWRSSLGLAPGAWVCGPFENQSEIAAYRPVSFENEPLDTLASTSGKLGVRVGWSWVDTDGQGTLMPTAATETAFEMAVQVRSFFSLPEAQVTNLLFGGAYRCRIIIDGVEVYNDKQYRSSHMREGIQATLSAGPHEIRLVLTDNGTSEIQTRILVLDKDYRAIEGLTWPRFAVVPERKPENVRVVHPIFDEFDEYIATAGPSPDTRFWRTYLQYQNGYHVEAIRELEAAAKTGNLSLLERWMLYEVLIRNQESMHAIEHLGIIKDSASVPMTDLTWITGTSENYEQQVRSWKQLSDAYPGRLLLEISHAMAPLMQGDKQAFVDTCKVLKERYPGYSHVSQFLQSIYHDAFKEPEMALREIMEYCDSTDAEFKGALYLRDYYAGRGDYDSAIVYSWKVAHKIATHPGNWQQLVAVYRLARRSEELIPKLDSLIKRYPYNVDTYALLYTVYSAVGDYEKGKQILQALHEMKPTATLPYSLLEDLRHGAPIDSLFVSADVMSVWNESPTPEQMGNASVWYLCDNRQTLLYSSGVKLIDIHWAAVVTDRRSVEDMQEVYLGLDTSVWSNRLLTARRLRKGQPPLAGVFQNQSVIFQDLQPGDAVEVRYRYWAGNYGDLWSEFWDRYVASATVYEQEWKYILITDRDDILIASDSLFPQAAQDKHFGFNRWTWQGTRVSATDLDQTLMPPWEDIAGKMVISTIDSWKPLHLWYRSISEAILGDNVRTDELADDLVEPGWSDRRKLEALYSYVVMNIPYQVIDFDYHAAIPHTPDEVLVNQWGDCKDKGHLLIQMLRHVGIEAWPVLVATRSNGTSTPPPSFYFDHLIVACTIDGERVFVDPTNELNPPISSILEYIAGQPCLVIDTALEAQPGRLPHLTQETSRRTYDMTIEPNADGDYRFVYLRGYYNIAAGEARADRRSRTLTEQRKDAQTSMAKSWGLTVQIDSLWQDSVLTIDSVFHETLTGSISLPTQHIGPTTIVSLPEWPLIPRSELAMLMAGTDRTAPVDLHAWAGSFERTVRLTIPEAWGTPQLTDPTKVTGEQWTFEATPHFDPNTRILEFTYTMTIQDALVEPIEFTKFVKQVVDESDKPLVFTSN